MKKIIGKHFRFYTACEAMYLDCKSGRHIVLKGGSANRTLRQDLIDPSEINAI